MRRRLGSIALALTVAAATGCALPSPRMSAVSAEAASGFAGRVERKLVRNGQLELDVASFEESSAAVEKIVGEADGFVELATTGDESATLRCRVPAPQLETTMARLAKLGDVTRRSLSSQDVTEHWFDLETRLRNAVALRDRLRDLLERAKDVAEVLAVEKELTRVQTEVESLQGQFDRLKGQVELSALTVELHHGRVLGPLGYVGYGLWWVVEKLFVIR